jgi:hypothetical protein
MVFPMEPFDPSKYDRKGKYLVYVRVHVLGLPYHLWRDLKFHRIADELGGVLLDVDPRSADHIDFTMLRIRLGVPALVSIPSCRNIFFLDPQGKIKLYHLSFDTDISTNGTPPTNPWTQQTSVVA